MNVSGNPRDSKELDTKSNAIDLEGPLVLMSTQENNAFLGI